MDQTQFNGKLMTISKELLLAAGYKCWKENPINEPHTIRKWQKCVYSEDGHSKKYYIDIDETLGWNPTSDDHNFWPSVQFDIPIGDTYHNIKIELVQWFNESGKYSGLTIGQMEQEIESMFVKLNGKNYG